MDDANLAEAGTGHAGQNGALQATAPRLSVSATVAAKRPSGTGNGNVLDQSVIDDVQSVMEAMKPTFVRRSLSERLLETFLAYLPLGFTTLGGPQATISQYFGIFVVRRCVSERTAFEAALADNWNLGV